jgi:transposase
MNIHKNARLTPLRREEMAQVVIALVSKAQAAQRFGVSPKIVSRWVGRFKAENPALRILAIKWLI